MGIHVFLLLSLWERDQDCDGCPTLPAACAVMAIVQAAAPYKRGAVKGPALVGWVLQGALSTVEMGR